MEEMSTKKPTVSIYYFQRRLLENEQDKSPVIFENKDSLKISQKGEKSLMYLKDAGSLFHICFLNNMISF